MKYLLLVYGIVSSVVMYAQPANIKSTVQPGVWNDTMTWHDHKVPGPSDIVYLNNPVSLNTNGTCFYLHTNGYPVEISGNSHLDITGNYHFNGDSLRMYNVAGITDDTLQAHYTLDNTEYLFYGTRNANGDLEKITSCSYHTTGNTDTVVHAQYNTSGNIKAIYFTVNGVRDSLLLKFTYNDSFAVVTRYFVDWNTGIAIPRSVAGLKKANRFYAAEARRFSGAVPLSSDLAVAAAAFASLAVVNLILVSGAVVAAYYFTGSALAAAASGLVAAGYAMAETSVEYNHYAAPPPPPGSTAPYQQLVLTNPSLDDPQNTGITLPMLIMGGFTNISTNSAGVNAHLFNGGNSPVIARGICWSLNSTPDVDNADKIFNGNTVGSYGVTLSGLQSNKKYFVRAFATNQAGTGYSQPVSFKTLPQLPTVLTATALNIAETTADIGGEITDAGDCPVTARGICYSLQSNPTVDDQVVQSGSGVGSFTVSLSSLSTVTTYYYCAFATSGCGTTYGPVKSFVTTGEFFTDRRDGQVYSCHKYGNQVWMTQNLNYASANSLWYNNSPANGNTYGRLYNWSLDLSAIVAPPGWHLPSKAEWQSLLSTIGGSNVGGDMKTTTLWDFPNTGATNNSGFNGQPGGYGDINRVSADMGRVGGFYSSSYTVMWTNYPWGLQLTYNSAAAVLTEISPWTYYSIRCVKD